MTDDDAQVDEHGLTPADWDAAVDWWRRSLHPKPYYQQPRIRNRPARNSFVLPDDVVNALGAGDPKIAGSVIHLIFGLRPFTGEGNPLEIDPDMVAEVGHGSLTKGRKVLERFVQIVRRQSREGPVLQHVGAQHADDHGWRVVRR